MSTRRMAALIRGLPEDSAIGRLHSERESESEHDDGDKTVIRSGEAFATWMNTNANKA